MTDFVSSGGRLFLEEAIDNADDGPSEPLSWEAITLATGSFANEKLKIWSKPSMGIIHAGSVDHAKGIAAACPMCQAGARAFGVSPWFLKERSIKLRVTYLDGRRGIS